MSWISAKTQAWGRIRGTSLILDSPQTLTSAQALLREAHEVELQREKEAEKLERQLALPTSEQAATQVSPIHLLSPACNLTCPHLLTTLLPRSPCFGRCVRACWRSLMVRMSMRQAVPRSQRLVMGPPRSHPLVLLVLRRGWRRRRSSSGGGRKLLASW